MKKSLLNPNEKKLIRSREKLTKKYEKYLKKKNPYEKDPEIEGFDFKHHNVALLEAEEVAKQIFEYSLFSVQKMELDKVIRPYAIHEILLNCTSLHMLYNMGDFTPLCKFGADHQGDPANNSEQFMVNETDEPIPPPLDNI